MVIHAEVKNKKNESNMNLIRRFRRKVNSSGVLRQARKLRHHTRSKSQNVQKKNALEKIERKEEIEKMIKLGKLPDRRGRKMKIEPDE